MEKKKQLMSAQFHQAATFQSKTGSTILTGVGPSDRKRHGVEIYKSADGIAIITDAYPNLVTIVPWTNVKHFSFEVDEEPQKKVKGS